MGNLGEVLTFLTFRSRRNHKIQRVVSGDFGQKGKQTKGGKFPRPDFLLEKDFLLRALEVKSTQLFDYLDLLEVNKRRRISPCREVAKCRELALPQLGFVGDTFVSPQHNLKLIDGDIVPFPTGKGVAVTVLPKDGRVETLRNDKRYRPLPSCVKAKPARSCWSCVEEHHGVTLVEMANAPGRLSLAGASPRPTDWFNAYARWAQAIDVREPYASDNALERLAAETLTWLEQFNDVAPDDGSRSFSERATLAGFWGSYLGDAMRSRGMSGDTALPNLAEREFAWQPVERLERSAEKGSLDGLEAWLGRAQQGDADWGVYAARIEQNSIVVDVSNDRVEVGWLSREWWTHAFVERDETAQRVAADLLAAILGADRQALQLPMREVAATVDQTPVKLGWVPDIAARPWRVALPMPGVPLWLFLLVVGDPRVKLRVHRHGRATLTMPRELWSNEPAVWGGG